MYRQRGGDALRRSTTLARSTRGASDEVDEELDYFNEISGLSAPTAGDEVDIDNLRFGDEEPDPHPIGQKLEPVGYHMNRRPHDRAMPYQHHRRGRYADDYDEEPRRQRFQERAMRRRVPPRRNPRMSGASAVAKNAGYGSQVYYEKFDQEPAENLGNDIINGDVPVAYDTIRMPFHKKTSLAEAASLQNGHEIRVPLDFGKSAMAKKIADSGAYLGSVSIKKLRHTAPVSLAVSCQCEPCGSVMPGVNLRAPTCALSGAVHPVHEVLSKRMPVGAGVDFTVRDVHPARNTFLSNPRYQGRWTAGNVHDGISPVGQSSKVLMHAEHPVVDFLSEKGAESQMNLLDDGAVMVEGHLVDDALGELKSQEHGNCFFKNAEGLNLVFHKAYGSDTKQIGKPAMTDPYELLDNVPEDSAKREEMIQRRLNQPFVIEGEWEVSYGKPIALSDTSLEARDEEDLLGGDGHDEQEHGYSVAMHQQQGLRQGNGEGPGDDDEDDEEGLGNLD